MLMHRLQWIALALAVTGITISLFDRFDPAGTNTRDSQNAKGAVSGEVWNTLHVDAGLGMIHSAGLNRDSVSFKWSAPRCVWHSKVFIGSGMRLQLA